MQTNQTKFSKKTIGSWALYDWANSAVSTIILTFVYAVYFTKSVASDEVAGTSLWAYAVAIAGVLTALTAFVASPIADHAGYAKRRIGVLTALSCFAIGGLYWTPPQASDLHIWTALGLVVFATVTMELAIVFYNALLPVIAPKSMMGRVSGWAWGLGYVGGLAALALCLFLLTGLGEARPPLLSLPTEDSQNIRASALLTAFWFALFSLPLFLFLPDTKPKVPSWKKAFKLGLADLKNTAPLLKNDKNLLTYLVASAVYRDGLATLFAMGGIYASATYGMGFTDLLIFAMGLNVTAGLGAFAFAFMDDAKGSKTTIFLALTLLIATGIAVLFAPDKTAFMGLALLLGLFIGPVQAASRTLAGRLAPQGHENRIYGLYALTGKSIAFAGPLVYGLATATFASQKAGLISILIFWGTGLALLAFVREQQKRT